jgi:uncharacterized protein YrrD
MKRSEELLGLSVISIEDGKENGCVSDYVINPSKGMIEYLIIDNGFRYMGIKILPFKMVEGVGAYAVTILSSSSITDLSDEPDVNELLEKNVRIKNTKVLTKKGKLIGNVSEFIINDDDEGKISACEVVLPNGGSAGLISSDMIVTFGKDVLVVSEDAEPVPPEPGPSSPEGSKPPAAPTGPAILQPTAVASTEPVTEVIQQVETKDAAAEKQEASQAAKLFEERQRQYLLGRKANKRIETETGELVIEEGETITEELMDKAKAAGKFAELSMNNKA